MRATAELVPLGATVADVMCGTASVSAALRTSGYRVIASDVMTYAVQHATVRLTLDSPPAFANLGLGSYEEVLRYLNALPPVNGHMVTEYSPVGTPAAGCAPRMYLTAENAAKIDAINQQLNAWNESGLLTRKEYSLLRHDFVLATNRVANIAGTYGHYRSQWSNGALIPITLIASDFIWGFSCDHDVRQGPAETLASEITADLCYIDPPYMKRQYAANYHLIETIARGDEPEAIGVSGLRPWRDQYSDFCSKLKIRTAFAAILTGMNCSKFMISYSEDGLLSQQEMLDFLRSFGEVDLHIYQVPRFRSNRSPLGRTMSEYLFTLKRQASATSTQRLLVSNSPVQHVSDAM
jgi:adenine-specific DNA-methyltransferase